MYTRVQLTVLYRTLHTEMCLQIHSLRCKRAEQTNERTKKTKADFVHFILVMCARVLLTHSHTHCLFLFRVSLLFFFVWIFRALPSFVKQQSNGLMLLLLLSCGIIWKHCNVPNPHIIHCCSLYAYNNTKKNTAAFWALLLWTIAPTPTTLDMQTNEHGPSIVCIYALLCLKSNKMTNHERYKKRVASLHPYTQDFRCVLLCFHLFVF